MDRWGNRDLSDRWRGYDRDWDDERAMWNRDRYDARNYRDYDRGPSGEYVRERDFGWRGTELDRGFGNRYEYDRGYDFDRDRDRYRDYDRGHDIGDRIRSGVRRMGHEVRDWADRTFDRDRDRDWRFRDREYGRDYYDEYPWSRGRGW